MTVEQRAVHLEGAGATGKVLRRFVHGALFAGKVGCIAGGQAVSEKSGTPNMSVDVAGGFCVTSADDQAGDQGGYVIENLGVENVPITAGNPSNPRHDLICAYVTDTEFGAASSRAWIAAVEGTAAASPQDPTVPDNAVVLARVVVPANESTSIDDADITDLRASWPGQEEILNRNAAKILNLDTVGTGAVVTSTAANISGLALNFQSRAGQAYIAHLQCGLWANATTQNNGFDAVGRLAFRVDDTDIAGLAAPQDITQIYYGDRAGGGYGATILTGLTAGSHTLRIQAETLGGSPDAELVGGTPRIWITEFEF